MKKKLLLLCGIVLVGIGLFKPNLNNINSHQISTVNISAPSDPNLKKEAQDIIDIMKNSRSLSVKADSAQLRDLYLSLATMISLDKQDVVVNTTEDIRKANSISGHLLQAVGVDLSGKYANLSKECQDVIVLCIGDDIVSLSPDLRKKAAESFITLAWAFNEINK